MVTIHTQYRKHYKGPSWDDFAISEYNRKIDYRIGRRSVEQRHQPFEWDSSSGSENSDVEFETTRQTNAQKQTEILPHEERAGKRDIRNKTLAGKGLSEGDTTFVKQAWGTGKDLDTDERIYSQKATQTTHRRHRKRKRKKAGKCIKDKAEMQGLAKDRKEERVPFVPYGWANDAPIEKKYTHNVRAHPKDVYPASLRALKRRELDITKRLEENKKKVQFEREIIKEKFFNLSHISPMFMTEYQSSYCNMDGEKTGYVW